MGKPRSIPCFPNSSGLVGPTDGEFAVKERKRILHALIPLALDHAIDSAFRIRINRQQRNEV